MRYNRLMVAGKLLLIKTRPGPKAWITIDKKICSSCLEQPCTLCCPAACYYLVEDKLQTGFDGCLECGTCRVVCPHDAVNWGYPQSGFGIRYRFS